MKTKNETDYNCDLVVIGGVGYNNNEEKNEEKNEENENQSNKLNIKDIKIETEFGDVFAKELKIETEKIVIIPRHFGKKHVPPHKINYRAIISAAASFNAPVLSINSVGSMKNYDVGSFFVPDDFLDLTKSRVCTFFDEKTVHTDMSDPYCVSIRNVLKKILKEKDITYNEGVYVTTEGPRFETKAEINFYKNFGDVVGMTGVPEVVLAKELGLCYASLCLITNPAAGIESGRILTIKEVTDAVEKSGNVIGFIVPELARRLRNRDKCNCKNSMKYGEI